MNDAIIKKFMIMCWMQKPALGGKRMKALKKVLIAVALLAIAVLVPSPALMEGAFFTLYGQFIAVTGLFAILLVNSSRKQILRIGRDDAAIDVIRRVDTPTLALCCIPAALVGARLLYCLFRFDFYAFEVGVAGVLRIWEGGFLLYGALLGVLAAVAALAKAKQVPMSLLLDEIAAPCMMAISISRMAEGMTTEGVGMWIEGGFFCRFPFAVQNEWGEWQLAMYVFETAVAVAILFYVLHHRAAPGETFLTALLLYAGCQIVLESLRMDGCLRIGFVRVSQVLSGAAVFTVTLMRALRVGKKPALISGGLCLAGIAVAGIIEWALDKTAVSNLILYPVMIAVCVLLIANGMRYEKKKA